MPHEIYYTSAPHGVRPGQQGFCTVATSDGIPKILWDRLESISGYRHPFDPGDGRNPVAWAHWLVQAGGRDVSVLSRVGDAGLDYTRRTNAFAHHLALDPDERAAAGPAWMLAQPGVMARQWDGQVGAIARPAALPRGDVRPAVCAAWQRVAGDAGWGGVLAESATKNAKRTVCLLFTPEQDPMPLVAEAIALLPARARWQVTFNTYFTSLPASAACAWRCCLAGTPAAAEAMRHAAGWLVLDLANPSRLGAPPAGPWAELARTGRGAGAAAAPAPRVPSTVMRFRKDARTAPEPEPIESADELMDFAELAPPPPPLRPGRAAGSWAATFRRSQPATGAAGAEADRPAEAARAVDTTWSEMRRRARRRWLVALSALALAFAAAGVWLQVSAYRSSSSRPLPPDSQPATVVVVGPPPETAVEPPPDTPRPTVVSPTPAPTAVTKPTPPPAPVAPAPRPPPVTIVLASAVDSPAAGVGARDVTQVVPVPAAQFDDLPAVASVQLLLPGDRPAYAARLGELAGTLAATADTRDRLRQLLKWSDAANPSVSLEVAAVRLDVAKPAVDVTWKARALVNRPEVVALTRVLLQQASLVAADERRQRPQAIRFKPADPVTVDLVDPMPAPTGGRDLPPGVTLRTERGLPESWQMTSGWEWASGDGRHTSETATAVLRFDRPAAGDQPACDFAVRLDPGWRSGTSTFAAQRQKARAADEAAAAEVARIDAEAATAREGRESALAPARLEQKQALLQLHLTDAELRLRSVTRKDAEQRVERANEAFATQAGQWQESMNAIMARHDEADRARQTAHGAAVAYDQFAEVDLAVELPDGIRASTLRLKRAK